MTGRAEVAERRAKALALRVAGLHWQQIADQLGHKTPGAAAQDVTRALDGRRAEMNGPPDEFTALELERLEALERAAWTVLRRHSTPDGDLEAIDRLIRISESRRRLVRERIGPGKREANPVDELRARRAARVAERLSAAQADVASPG
jgi:hypothetical protein